MTLKLARLCVRESHASSIAYVIATAAKFAGLRVNDYGQISGGVSRSNVHHCVYELIAVLIRSFVISRICEYQSCI